MHKKSPELKPGSFGAAENQGRCSRTKSIQLLQKARHSEKGPRQMSCSRQVQVSQNTVRRVKNRQSATHAGTGHQTGITVRRCASVNCSLSCRHYGQNFKALQGERALFSVGYVPGLLTQPSSQGFSASFKEASGR